jgi:hypothetical protein
VTEGGSRDRPDATLVEPHRSTVRYPGGLTARYRWVGSGHADALRATSEQGGSLIDHGPLVAAEPDRLCRAEVRVEGPLGVWTARFASVIYDEPDAVLWDTHGLLLARYGFGVYALAARTGELAWMHASGTPLVAVLASSRLPHVVVQGEVETLAIREDGEVAWRLAHSEVVAEAELVAGQLMLTTYAGVLPPIDPATGRTLG